MHKLTVKNDVYGRPAILRSLVTKKMSVSLCRGCGWQLAMSPGIYNTLCFVQCCWTVVAGGDVADVWFLCTGPPALGQPCGLHVYRPSLPSNATCPTPLGSY